MVKELQGSLCTRYYCNLTVSNPSAHSQYTVSVKLRKQGKFIKSSDHSEFAMLCMGSQGYRAIGSRKKYRDDFGTFASVTSKDFQTSESW